jgi:RHS repeat-associated protein
MTSYCKFNTHELDQTGLSYFNARYYDSDTGRFISPDPTVPDPTSTQHYNRYMFVTGNPISLMDASGYSGGSGGNSNLPQHISDLENENDNDDWRDIVNDSNSQSEKSNQTNQSDVNPDNSTTTARDDNVWRDEVEISNQNTRQKEYDYPDSINTTTGDLQDNLPTEISEIPSQQRTPGASVYVAPILGDSAVSIAPLGIILVGVLDTATIQHEYGHYLQHEEMGTMRWLREVARPSLNSAANDPNNHMSMPYERDATRRAIDYYGPNSAIANNPRIFPR